MRRLIGYVLSLGVPSIGFIRPSVYAVLILFGVYPAQAQTSCVPLEQAEATLHDSFGEKPMIEWDMQLAEGAPARVARIYGNTQTGSLTILIIIETAGHRVGCIGGSGENMRIAPQFKPAEHAL